MIESATPGKQRTLTTPDTQKLDDIYAQLERHYLGVQELHPGHVEALWEATRRLEHRADTLAGVWAWLQSAPWMQPKQEPMRTGGTT